MKKLVFMFVAMVAVSFASCGGNNNEATEAQADSTVVEEVAPADTVVADSAATDSTVNQ